MNDKDFTENFTKAATRVRKEYVPAKLGIQARVSRHDMAIIRLDVLSEVKARIEREIRAIKTKHKI